MLFSSRTPFGMSFAARVTLAFALCVSTFCHAHAQEASPGDHAIRTQRYQIGPNFDRLDTSTAPDRAGAVDPFAPGDSSSGSSDQSNKTIQQTLIDDLGIEFPEGTYARINGKTGELEIRHQPAILRAIEIYLDEVTQPYSLLNVRVEIFQMPIADAMHIQRITDSTDDDTAVWEAVQKRSEVDGSHVTAVNALTTQTRSGQRSKAEDINEFIYPTEIDWSPDKQAFVPAAFETRNYGTMIEADLVLGVDEVTVDLNFSLEHHTAPPTMHPITLASPEKGIELTTVKMPEFHTKRITTAVTMRANTVKLIGAWRPTGKPEFEDAQLMQVAFLRVAMQKIRSVVPIQ